MPDRTIAMLASALQRGELSSVELTHTSLDKITHGADLNAFITVDPERALDQAAAADKRLRAGDSGPLTGIPIAHKDIFCTQGLLTTCGSRMLHNYVSPFDATVVEKLDSAGMVTVGKTNMDEFAMGSSNETSWYGPVKNPWHTNSVPGGSSGGSAAAVAAGMVPVATGTDTGGSIRQPAAFCGLTGIKPSYGRVSRYGMIAFASSLDQGGVLARNAEDAALVLGEMAGFDPRDSTSVDAPVPDLQGALTRDVGGLTVGLPREFFGDGVDPEVARAVDNAIRELQLLGVNTLEVELPNSPLGIPCYYVIAPAEASSNLARFDGVRYGHRAEEYVDLADMYESTRAQGFGPEVQRRIMVGTYVLSSGYYDAYYIKAQKIRRLIADDFKLAFERCDLIVGPTTPTTAFPIGDKCDDPVAMYLNDIFTSSVNLAGLPGLSLPVGFDNNGKPIGLHLVGRYFDEATLLNVAHRYQQATNWHLQRPGDPS